VPELAPPLELLEATFPVPPCPPLVPEWSAFVNSYHSYAYVSLDGPSIVHDRHRLTVAGTGSHAQVRVGLLRLAEAGTKVGVVSVLNPDTAHLASAIAEEVLSLPVLRANVVCNLRAQWDDAALETLRSRLLAAMEPWKRAFRADKALHFEPFTSKILTHLHAAMPCVSRCRFRGDDLTVAPSGRLYTCGERVGDDHDLTYAIGSLETGIDEAKLALFREQKERIEVHCQDCELRERCSSSCGCRHLALTGAYGKVTYDGPAQPRSSWLIHPNVPVSPHASTVTP
jgi:uncharacterized protein